MKTTSHRCWIPLASCLLLAMSGRLAAQTAAAGEPLVNDAVSKAATDTVQAGDKVLTLFNGRDFTGWETKGRWIVDQGAIYCDHRYQAMHTLIYRGSKLPADFDLRFQWKTRPAAGSRNAIDGGFGLGDGGSAYTDARVTPPKVEVSFYARAICHVGGNAFEFYTSERRIPWEKRPQPDSLFHFRGPDEAVPEHSGWNDARIVCRGPRIETWINGRRTLEFDAERGKTESPGVARPLGEWLTRKPEGLELRIQPGGCRAWYRDITLRTVK